MASIMKNTNPKSLNSKAWKLGHVKHLRMDIRNSWFWPFLKKDMSHKIALYLF